MTKRQKVDIQIKIAKKAMNQQELLNRLTDIEWDDFEVKEARTELPKNIWETVSAFSNVAGGWIVLGVVQKGKIFEIQGVENPEKLEQDFTTVLRSRNKFNVLIHPKCLKYNMEGKMILSFFIPSSEQKPVYFNTLSNTFIRSGSGDQRASESEINALLRDQLFGAMSAQPAKKTSLDDLNRTTLYRYRDYMSRFNPGLSYNMMPETEFLEKLQIVEGTHLTYGGLLFMGKNLAINRSIPDFRVDLLEIPGKSYAEAIMRYTFRLEEQENLWEYYFAIIERLKRQVDMPFKMNELGIAIEDSPQFEAIREALVNLLMHNDYFCAAKPRVRIFSDRIEFENPGNFPLPIEILLKKDISLPRNPVIAKLFRCVKLAENAGYGFDKILKWEKSTNTKVIFENSIDFSLVTFKLPENLPELPENLPELPEKLPENLSELPENLSELPENLPENLSELPENLVELPENLSELPEKLPENLSGLPENPIELPENTVELPENPIELPEKLPENTVELPENQFRMIMIMKKNSYVTITELSKQLKISETAIKSNIRKLKSKGFVERVGPDKGGYWKIKLIDES